MNTPDLQTLLSQPPASFAWSQSEDGVRTIGTSIGCAVDIWPDRVEVAATLPPDDAELAGRNGVILTLILVALRPDWPAAPEWLASQLRMAARAKSGVHEGMQYSRGARLFWSAKQSLATLKVRR